MWPRFGAPVWTGRPESLKPGRVEEQPLRYSRINLAAFEVTLAGEGLACRTPPGRSAVHTNAQICAHPTPQVAVVLCLPTSVALLPTRYRIYRCAVHSLVLILAIRRPLCECH